MASIASHLLACGAVRFGEFTLTSGQKSRYYIDVKLAMTQPTVLRAIATAMAKHVAAGEYDAVAGMELGAVPIATALSLETDLPLCIVRKGERGHGTGKRIEGDAAGKRIFVVEDVTTSGGSTRDAIRVLRQAGATVDTACVVVDRESGGVQHLADEDVRLLPLVSVSELLATPEAKKALEALP